MAKAEFRRPVLFPGRDRVFLAYLATLQMAAAVVAVLPILVLFLFFQRYFVRGNQLTGMKG